MTTYGKEPGVSSKTYVLIYVSGARLSSAQLSLWRIIGTCASQHSTLQNAKPVRLRLQVETLQTQYRAPLAMGFLQVEQGFQIVVEF
jgi:hypothetical protein